MHFDAPLPIFIARDKQIKAFRSYFRSWLESVDTNQRIGPSDEQYDSSSTIQGLFVLVHGHGGMGKSTLLKQYHKIVAEHADVRMSSVINYQRENTLSSRQEDQPQTDNVPNISAFFASLTEKLIYALDIDPSALKEYKLACQTLRNFREQLRKCRSLYVAERQQKRLDFASSTHSSLYYTGTSQNNVDSLINSIDTFLRKDSDIPSLYRQEIKDMLPYASSQDEKSGSFWEPGRLLGEALGRDLCVYATSYPLLLFFDPYEYTEEDKYLRIVMHKAGKRVGWVIASRDDLWSGYASLYKYKVASEGYQEIVMHDRSLSIDLNSPKSGFFSESSIRLYFNKLRAQRRSLPAISSDQLKHIASITQGIPLGVRILAGLYIKDPDVLLKLSSVNSPAEVVDQLVLHYLASPEQKEILQLCGLALLQRKKNIEALLIALGLSADQQNSYEDTMTHLRRHADFTFDDHKSPFLHDVVRNIIRQWLLKHRHEPNKRQLFFRLKDVYDKARQEVQRKVVNPDLHDLFATPQWVEASLDLIEILFWIDEETGMHNALPFLIASSVYSHPSTQKLIKIVAFFETHISAESFADWQDATNALSLDQSHQFTDQQKVQKLKSIKDDFIQQASNHDSLLSDYQREVIALLDWKAGDASLYDERRALEWYLKAWEFLDSNQMLQRAIVRLCLQGAYRAFDKGQYEQSEFQLEQARAIHYREADIYYTLGNIYYAQGFYERSITFYQYAIIIEEGRHRHAYMNLANAHYMLKGYQRAIDEYDRVQQLASGRASYSLYYNRANAYAALKNFKQAKDDYDQAILLEPQLAWAYGNRGHVHAALLHYTEALCDYACAAERAPDDINVVWTATWAKFDRLPPRTEDGAMLLLIAELDPHHYAAWICRAVAASIQKNDWSAALSFINQAIELAPEKGTPHLWKGLIMAYLGETSAAKEEVEKALSLGLPPLFLTPLRWLQNDNSEFFSGYIEPLLEQYHL